MLSLVIALLLEVSELCATKMFAMEICFVSVFDVHVVVLQAALDPTCLV